MKIIITGASGFVGSLLVSELSGREHELILIGRNKETLANRFLGHQVMTYDEFERSPIKADALVHLAVLNNTSKGSYDDFVKINVALLEKILAASVRKKSPASSTLPVPMYLIRVAAITILEANCKRSNIRQISSAMMSKISLCRMSIQGEIGLESCNG